MKKLSQEQIEIEIVKRALNHAFNNEADAIYRAKIREVIGLLDNHESPVVTAVLYVDLGIKIAGCPPVRKYVLHMPEGRDHVTWTEDIDAAMVFNGVRDIEQGRKEVERRTHIAHGVVFV